ncbi:g1326 [Coccomyxa viridis]|uniref:G1326 protein n=1 Tax=Coccomyxa viridis TaxID=1274662 RepID=A0ABP1FN64_9CHLO
MSLDRLREHKGAIAGVLGAGLAATAIYYIAKKSYSIKVRQGRFRDVSLPEDTYDAVIVGAGPSGSTCAYYLTKNGAKVALIDKETFPRDKYCGDAVCTPALNILEDMGVLKELVDNNEAHFADSGGFVSPSGLAYIGQSQEKLGGAAACAVKRTNLDKRIAWKARDTGADLREGFEVGKQNPTFDQEEGLWTVSSTEGKEVKGRMLVIADGATSKLAMQMGYCTEPPKGVCSRAFIEGGTHNVDFDGVCFYQRESLPGYSAIFRHPNDELNFCYYLIPCGKDGMCGDVSEADLKRLHDGALKSDPFISKAIGPNAKIERMRAAALRLGSQGVPQSYDDHLIIVGDAAGHIDPLTGEGIHTAMMGGKAAADTILEMRECGDFSAASTRVYQQRWMQLFGHDFAYSKKGAELIYKYPILLDACANEMARVGDKMMVRWAEVMTNMRPKTYFLRPDVAVPLGFALLREWWAQKVSGRPDKYKTGLI